MAIAPCLFDIAKKRSFLKETERVFVNYSVRQLVFKCFFKKMASINHMNYDSLF